MLTQTAHYDQQQVESTVTKVEQQFGDKIERIIYSIGEDWAGDPAIFFRILLMDDAITQGGTRPAQHRAMADLSILITSRLNEAVRGFDVQPYFSFRTVSEQNDLRDPEWI